jgi:transcriptional regulator with XRE-family HTH domain
LVEDSDEMVVVERIRELRAEGMSLRQIAEALTENGLRPIRSGRWHPETVKRVLDRVG